MADERDRPGPDDEPAKPTSQADHDDSPSADDRDREAEHRDQVAAARDRVSETRDATAEERDRRAERREQARTEFDPEAADDRAGAGQDRRAGAADRTHAAGDRVAASTDRALSAGERAASSIDELTGAYRRDAGMVELARELARAKRTQTPLVFAFIDVDGLKTTNDSLGHAAGDELLRRVVTTLRTRVRPYDLIVRIGGDEFVCAMPDSSMVTAAARFSLVNADLAAATPHSSVSTGLAELTASDGLDDVIARADASLRAERQRRGPPRGGHRE